MTISVFAISALVCIVGSGLAIIFMETLIMKMDPGYSLSPRMMLLSILLWPIILVYITLAYLYRLVKVFVKNDWNHLS